MTAYTSAAPFEFKGVKVYRAENGTVCIRDASWAFRVDHALAVHAFLEAERDTWAWTNDEHTEARRGRWTAKRLEGDCCVCHDDFPGVRWFQSIPAERPSERVTDRVLTDFLSWSAAERPQPVEPTGFGYVGYVTTEDGDVWDVSRDNYSGLPFRAVSRTTGDADDCWWSRVLSLGTFTAVTR